MYWPHCSTNARRKRPGKPHRDPRPIGTSLPIHEFCPGLGDDDLAWLFPPTSTSDPSAWDHYWNAQVAHGLGPPLFDMFCDDTLLVETMRRHGMTRALCAGNGISQEPRALAEAGLQVTALDLSPTHWSWLERGT